MKIMNIFLAGSFFVWGIIYYNNAHASEVEFKKPLKYKVGDCIEDTLIFEVYKKGLIDGKQLLGFRIISDNRKIVNCKGYK